MRDGETITIGPPIREVPGFGCPACGAFLDLGDRRGLALGRMRCCGYSPTPEETARWLAGARLLRANDLR